MNTRIIAGEEYIEFRRKAVSYMRRHVVGEDLTGISVSPQDHDAVLSPGGWIACNLHNPDDRWYVNKDYFEKNFEAV